MWDSVGDAPAESYTTHNFTRAAVYDPVDEHVQARRRRGLQHLLRRLRAARERQRVRRRRQPQHARSAGIRQTHVFDWRTETWSRGPDMQDGRWYPSVASLPNDEALIIGGGPTDGRDPHGRRLACAG